MAVQEYWQLALQSLKAAVRGVVFRRQDVALLTGSHSAGPAPAPNQAQDCGDVTNKDSVTSRSTGDQKANTGRVYVAFTPYHLILIRALQMGYQGTPALVVVADEARISQIIPEIWTSPASPAWCDCAL